MSYVKLLARLMWIAVQTGSPFGSLGSLRSLASVHVESTCEISSILSLVPDSPNHPTCLLDSARRLPDMSSIRHQASLANSMMFMSIAYVFKENHSFLYYSNVKWTSTFHGFSFPACKFPNVKKPWQHDLSFSYKDRCCFDVLGSTCTHLFFRSLATNRFHKYVRKIMEFQNHIYIHIYIYIYMTAMKY